MLYQLFYVLFIIDFVVPVPYRAQKNVRNTFPRLKVDANGYRPTLPDGNIVGGVPAEPYSYPWQVVLWIDYNWFCSGTLISDRWVLTAAHCLEGFLKVEVVLGVNNPKADEDNQVSVWSEELIYHEDYGHLFYTNDIGVIKLSAPVNFTDYIKPINLTPRDPGNGSEVVITGWGFQSDDDYYLIDLSDQLMELTSVIITDEECKAVFGARHWEQDLCIAGTGGIGSCNGDSGGPMHYDLYGNGAYVVAGICSFGASTSCEEGYPSAYTSVENYLEWIQNKTGVIPLQNKSAAVYNNYMFSAILLILLQYLN